MNDVTQILSRIDAGDPSAAEQLLPLVYDELRKLASAKMAREKSGQNSAGDSAGARSLFAIGRWRAPTALE